MPNEIDIHIIERKPIAWITSEKTVLDPFASDAAFLVDARGILMKEKKLLPEYLALPLITGCASEALVPGKDNRIFRGEDRARASPPNDHKFYADPVSNSRDRFIERLLPARDR